MRERTTALVVALGLAVVALGCGGGAETSVVNQYFTALAADDTNTLTSFALVKFDQKVDSWKVVSVVRLKSAPGCTRIAAVSARVIAMAVVAR